jgi:hypothetical protein
MSHTPDDPGGPDQPLDDTDPDPDDPDDPTDTDDDDDFDASTYDGAGKRRLRIGKRLVGVVVGAVVLVGAGAAFVLISREDGGGNESAAGADDRDAMQNALTDAQLDYAECMRENGLEDWPDPVVDEDGGVDVDPGGGEEYDLDDPEVQAANGECQPILDDVEAQYGPELSPEELTEMQDQVLAMAQCMRDHGWDFPDPEVSTDDPGGGVAVGVVNDGNLPEPGDPDFEQFEQDQDECQVDDGPSSESDGGG